MLLILGSILRASDFDIIFISAPYSFLTLDVSDIIYPSDFKILKNYPNPFNPNTTINYSLAESGIVKINIYDINGRIVDEILNDYKIAGQHSLNWSPSNIPSGMYYITLMQGSSIDQLDIMYIK